MADALAFPGTNPGFGRTASEAFKPGDTAADEAALRAPAGSFGDDLPLGKKHKPVPEAPFPWGNPLTNQARSTLGYRAPVKIPKFGEAPPSSRKDDIED